MVCLGSGIIIAEMFLVHVCVDGVYEYERSVAVDVAFPPHIAELEFAFSHAFVVVVDVCVFPFYSLLPERLALSDLRMNAMSDVT